VDGGAVTGLGDLVVGREVLRGILIPLVLGVYSCLFPGLDSRLGLAERQLWVAYLQQFYSEVLRDNELLSDYH